jgi:hypothetical protein
METTVSIDVQPESNPRSAHQKGNNRADQEYEEQYLRDPCGTGGDSSESQYGCDQRNYKKYNRVMKHVLVLRRARVRPGLLRPNAPP